MTGKSLAQLREAIREIDGDILRLLNERAARSVEIGQVKRSHGVDVYSPAQESRVIDFLSKHNTGPLNDAAVREIFREIFSSSRALQEPLTVVYLGPEASFSHLAALAHFGRSAELVPTGTIDQVFDLVERGNIALGIVPVENSTEGSVGHTLRRLIATPLDIRAEVFLRISQCLMSHCLRKEEIHRVYSHPQALAQCRNWLRENLPQAEQVETASTSEAGQRAHIDPEGGAAVGSRLSAAIHGLSILAEDIEDNPANTTRFLVIGKSKGEPTGRDKTSILFGTPHVPGALFKSLETFAREQINLLRIESHPLRDRMWEYLFFADFAGHQEDEQVRQCLQDMEGRTTFLKILGSYPRGEETT
ncbi:MAG: prephenate dehydratase [Syntrophales bacterium]